MKKNMVIGFLVAGALAMVCDVQAMLSKGTRSDAAILRQVQELDQQTCGVLQNLMGIALASLASYAQTIFEATGAAAVAPLMGEDVTGDVRDVNFIAQIGNRYIYHLMSRGQDGLGQSLDLCLSTLTKSAPVATIDRIRRLDIGASCQLSPGEKVVSEEKLFVSYAQRIAAQLPRLAPQDDKGFVAELVANAGMHGMGMLIFIAMVGNRYAYHAAVAKKDVAAQGELNRIYGELHMVGKNVSRAAENAGAAAGAGWLKVMLAEVAVYCSTCSVRDVLGAAVVATVAVGGICCSNNPQAAYCPAFLFGRLA